MIRCPVKGYEHMKPMEKAKRLVVFAILMETGPGIEGKAPYYILEKYEAVMNDPNPETLLDPNNRTKFEKWVKMWE